MTRLLCAAALIFCVVSGPLKSQDPKTTATEDYLFAWAGDAEQKGNDFWPSSTPTPRRRPTGN